MRIGCAGCFTVVAFWSLLGAGALGAGGWLAFRLAQAPGIEIPATTQADSARAQRKVLDLFGRRRGTPRVDRTVIFSERELNALLARRLADEVPFSTPVARLDEGGVLDFAGRLPVRQLLGEPALSTLAGTLPRPWLDRPVWLRVRARVSVEHAGRPYARLHVEELQLGRQRLPVLLLRLLLDPASLTLLRLPLPDHVEDIRIQSGQLVIRTAS